MRSESSDTPDRLGRYEIVGLLATGGMAEVYLGRLRGPSGFDRIVVVKRILPHLARERVFVDMFTDEARIVAKIRHPGVVFVHELCREDNELFLVMEYVEGESLGSIMRRHWTKGMEVGHHLSAYICAQAAAGLHAAHELCDEAGQSLGVVHRDISPQNIMVTYTGQTKVLDFGIAKAADRATRTETGHLKGKYEYMSPQQIRGLPLDARSDVFSLGILLYELSTSRRLFRRTNEFATMKAITEEPLKRPSEQLANYPTELENICLRALARDPVDRYPSALAFQRDLLAYLKQIDTAHPTEELLSTRMCELFADRMQEKRDLCARLHQGSIPKSLPPTEVDPDIEEPTVERPMAAHGPSTLSGSIDHGTSTVSTRKARVGRLGMIALACVGAVTLAWLGLRPPVASPLNPGTGEASPEPNALTASSVSVQVVSTPPDAAVFVQGVVQGRTPVSVELLRGTTPVQIEIQMAGFANHSESIVPDVDQRLALTLTPVQARDPVPARDPVRRLAPTPKVPETAEPRPSGSPFRKFN